MFDTVIRGGTIVDGTGAAPYTFDVAIDVLSHLEAHR
jgi:N-acyl-D-aspartate/D-glutamate deacylase